MSYLQVVYNSTCVSMYVTFGLMTFVDHGAPLMRPNMLLKFTSILFSTFAGENCKTKLQNKMCYPLNNAVTKTEFFFC